MKYKVLFPFKIYCLDCGKHTSIYAGEIIGDENISSEKDRQHLIDHDFIEVINECDIVNISSLKRKRQKAGCC